jgi:hypothetical protein
VMDFARDILIVVDVQTEGNGVGVQGGYIRGGARASLTPRSLIYSKGFVKGMSCMFKNSAPSSPSTTLPALTFSAYSRSILVPNATEMLF